MALEEHEMNGRGGVLPLVVIDWILLLLKQTNRGGHFVNPPDFARNVDLLMNFKKSCGNTIKFASKNIPFALIQVIISATINFHNIYDPDRNFVPI